MKPSIDWNRIRADFPLLQREVHGKPLVYFDNANTGQKPAIVIETVDAFYRQHNANISRAVHTLGSEATEQYEHARRQLAKLVNVRADELILCSGTTFALNLVAYSFALPRLKPGDVIVVSRMEHHANIVPWQLIAERTGAKIRVAEIKHDGTLDMDALDKAMSGDVKLLALTFRIFHVFLHWPSEIIASTPIAFQARSSGHTERLYHESHYWYYLYKVYST